MYPIPASVYAAEEDPEFLILLPAPPKFWDYKQEQTCLVLCNSGDWTQDSLHARQVFYQLSYSPSALPMVLGDSSLLSSWNKRWYESAGNNNMRLLLGEISLQKNSMMILPVSERNPGEGYKHPTVHTVTVAPNEKVPERDAFCSESSEFCKPLTRHSWWSRSPEFRGSVDGKALFCLHSSVTALKCHQRALGVKTVYFSLWVLVCSEESQDRGSRWKPKI